MLAEVPRSLEIDSENRRSISLVDIDLCCRYRCLSCRGLVVLSAKKRMERKQWKGSISMSGVEIDAQQTPQRCSSSTKKTVDELNGRYRRLGSISMSPCSLFVSCRQRKAEDLRMEREAMNRNKDSYFMCINYLKSNS